MPTIVPYPQQQQNAYQHSSITVYFNGSPLPIGIKSLSYKQTLTPGIGYGTSPNPALRTKGKYVPTAAVEFYLNDMDNVESILGSPIGEAVFDISVSFSDFGMPDRRDVLKACRVMSQDFQSQEGEAPLTVKCELSLFQILRNGVPMAI